MMLLIRRLVLAAVATTLMWAPAALAQPYGGEGELTIDPATVPAGGETTVSAAGFAANAVVVLTLTSDPIALGSVTTDAVGAFSRRVSIPADTAPGSHTVTAVGTAPDGSSRVLRATATITAAGGGAATTTTTGSLSTTGSSNTGTLGGLAVAFIVIGGLLVVAVRRHRTRVGTA